jgi:hypothetical protein
MIHITEDHFVWLDVTEQMKHGHKKREEVWLSHELFAVHEDESDSMLESHDEIDEALKLGMRVCIEGGYLPLKYRPKKTWKDTDKQLINGYWYVKMSDIKIG